MKAHSRSLARRTALLILVGLVAAVFSGCSPMEPEPRPAVAWPNGEPVGELESDPWVQALRAADMELQVASVTRDFTAPELAHATGLGLIYEYRDNLRAAAENDSWKFPAGPTPMIPIAVKEASDGKYASVVVCIATDWYVSAGQPARPTKRVGTFQSFSVSIDGDGLRKVSARGLVMDDAARSEDIFDELRMEPPDRGGRSVCSLEDAALGYFDPLPDPTVEYGPEDIIVPE